MQSGWLKETVKHYLLHSGYEVIDLNSTQGSADFVDSTINAITEFRKYKQAFPPTTRQ